MIEPYRWYPRRVTRIFFRAGEFSWDWSTSINIHLKHEKEKSRRVKISGSFAWKLLKMSFEWEILPKDVKSRWFSNKNSEKSLFLLALLHWYSHKVLHDPVILQFRFSVYFTVQISHNFHVVQRQPFSKHRHSKYEYNGLFNTWSNTIY